MSGKAAGQGWPCSSKNGGLLKGQLLSIMRSQQCL
jgi:hypothetical protein